VSLLAPHSLDATEPPHRDGKNECRAPCAIRRTDGRRQSEDRREDARNIDAESHGVSELHTRDELRQRIPNGRGHDSAAQKARGRVTARHSAVHDLPLAIIGRRLIK
jgi:hypothetical protein